MHESSSRSLTVRLPPATEMTDSPTPKDIIYELSSIVQPSPFFIEEDYFCQVFKVYCSPVPSNKKFIMTKLLIDLINPFYNSSIIERDRILYVLSSTIEKRTVFFMYLLNVY